MAAAKDPYKYFRLEAREVLDGLAQSCLELERDATTAMGTVVPRMLRLAHTLKGAARVVKQPDIADRAHQLEATLEQLRDEPRAPGAAVPRASLTEVLAAIDAIQAHVARLDAPRVAAADGGTPNVMREGESFHTVRADVADMDALLDGVVATRAELEAIRKSAATVERGRHLAELLADQLTAAGRGTNDAASVAGADGARALQAARALTEELVALLGRVDGALVEGVERVERQLGQLRASAEQLRLVPASALFVTLERTALDVARAQHKMVSFAATGRDIRVDAAVLAAVQRALVQIVRNAVAHGIEPPAVRERSGKPALGYVSVSLARRAGRLVFRCADDGAGVNRAALRAHGADVQDDAPLDVLFRAGVSTSGAVTEVAGRGIGLDVVREVAERLGGTASVTSEPGRGATFEVAVPLSLTSIDTLQVESAGQLASIPLESVRASLRLADDDIRRSVDGDAVVYDGAVIPFLPLARALRKVERRAVGAAWSAVVVTGAGGSAAVGVDRLRGTLAVVVRPLPPLSAADAVVAGAALDADGVPQLVMDPDGLVALAHAGHHAVDAPAGQRLPILVIDDSLTTRMLEESILAAAGYRVETATSAEEALVRAREQRFALFLVDVEMPGMDGFTFIERTRADPALQHIPCILVTSRASAADRARGQRAGAQGHIAKNEFDQGMLLQLIGELVGGAA